MTEVVVGIDVGAERKGFHAAILNTASANVLDLLHFSSPQLLAQHLELLSGQHKLHIKAIAIDAPPAAWIDSSETRPAERELRQAGYRVQWTPRQKEQASSWMLHGARLWEVLQEKFSSIPLLECFPTAASNASFHHAIQLPLRLLAGKHNRKYYKDFIDACLAAQVALDYSNKFTIAYGPEDALGPIHNSQQPAKVCTLVMVRRTHKSKPQLLLGMKKRGFGEGYWNGFGGKIQTDDQTIQAAAARELEEEAGLTEPELKERGRLYFSFGKQREIIIGHVFLCDSFQGDIIESDEMRPQWFDIDSIPYDQMWQDDRYWLPYMLDGHSFTAYFHFDENQNLLAQNIQIPSR